MKFNLNNSTSSVLQLCTLSSTHYNAVGFVYLVYRKTTEDDDVVNETLYC